MLVKPNWDVFKSKFHKNPQGYFEWFSYLLYCREFDLEKGWHGYKDQPAVEKEPIKIGNEVISFQAKFYQADLSTKKAELTKMLIDARHHYPDLTKIIFYTNQTWTLSYPKKTKRAKDISNTQKDVESLALSLKIKIDWRTHESFFSSPLVCATHNDLSRYFFNDNDYKGWKRFGDWSSKVTDIKAEYYVDNDVQIILPNHKEGKSLSVVDGLNEIRDKLAQSKTSIRLVGLSGVGKTRFAQALFDSRIGDNALDIRHVWYCDSGNDPDPKPQHFIEQIIEKNETTIIIVDNCGQKLHSILTNSVINSQKVSLLTIEYDVTDGMPEETSVYRMKKTTTELLRKVIKRHFPELESININKIADFSGGNYRLALAIASNIDKSENLSILTDNELFERIFYQKGKLNTELESIGQIFSLVFSFNLEDADDTESEIRVLSALADVTPKKAYKIIEKLQSKDIVQKRGDFRAILPHALANSLAKQAISGLTNSELNKLLTDTTERLQTSFLKRISYLHDHDKVKSIVKGWLAPNGYFGLKILNEQLTELDLKNISLLTSISSDELLNILKLRHEKDSEFLSTSNPNYDSLANLLRKLAFFDRNFEEASLLLFEILKTDDNNSKNNSLKDLFTSLFHYHFSQNSATFATKTKVIERLSKNDNYDQYILDTLNSALGTNDISVFIDDDNGLIQDYRQTSTYGEIWDWFEFLLSKLNSLDTKYPEKCRKIFTDNLKFIIWISGRSEEAIKYLKIFHDRKAFTSALLEVKKIIRYDSEELKNVPILLAQLKAIETYLEPSKNDIQSLMKAYVLSSDSYLLQSIDHNENNPKNLLSGFDSYENLIKFIGDNLTREIVKDVLQDLLTSNNSTVRDIGKYSAIIYPNIDDFIYDLQLIQHSDKLAYNRFFLTGITKILIEKNWIAYKKTIDTLLSTTGLSIIAPSVMAEVSTKKEHFQFIIDKIVEYPDMDFRCLGNELGFKNLHQKISPDLFEYVLDELVKLNQNSILIEAFIYSNRRDEAIANKHINKILEILPEILNNKSYYDYDEILQFILSYSEDKRKIVFRIVKDMMSTLDYHHILVKPMEDILGALIKNNVNDCLNLIYNNDKFKYALRSGAFKELLGNAEESKVLDWIGEDQDKIKFWLAHTRLYRTTNQDGFEWSSILNELVLRSIKAGTHIAQLTTMIDNQILTVTSYSNSYSGALSGRLPLLQELKNNMEQQNHSELVQLIEEKEGIFRERIKEASERESEESREQQSFQW